MFNRPRIGIDPGTSSLLIYRSNTDFMLQVPSLAVRLEGTDEPAFIGNEALRLIQEKGSSFSPVRPVREGMIADEKAAIALLTSLIKQSRSHRNLFFQKPDTAVCVSAGATDVEKRAFRKALYMSGAGRVRLIEEPVAAAIGSGIDTEEPKAHMIVTIGGGKTDAAVLSSGRVIASRAIRYGGEHLNEIFCSYLLEFHRLQISVSAAEELKLQVGAAPGYSSETTFPVRGADAESGLPRTIFIHAGEFQKAYGSILNKILDASYEVLTEVPPEISGELLDRGIILCGGGALLQGLAPWMSEKLHIPVHLSPFPLEAAARGAALSFEYPAATRSR